MATTSSQTESGRWRSGALTRLPIIRGSQALGLRERSTRKQAKLPKAVSVNSRLDRQAGRQARRVSRRRRRHSRRGQSRCMVLISDPRVGVTAAHESAAAAMCVRLVDVSGILAIHIPTRSLLRSSSTHEPSDPPLRVVV